MTTRITVYDVDADGGTGGRAGTGTLIGPELVLAEAALADRLARGNGARLRVGIAADDGAAPDVEVDDVAQVLSSDGAAKIAGPPLVALVLARPSQAPPVDARTPGADEALGRYLDAVRTLGDDDEAPAVLTFAARRRKPPWCSIFGGGPGC
jgi:hypothetical protein